MKPLFLSLALLTGCEGFSDVRRAEVTQNPLVMDQFLDKEDSGQWAEASEKCSMKSENFVNKTLLSYRSSIKNLDWASRAEIDLEADPELAGELIDKVRQSYFSDCMNRVLPNARACQLVPTEAIEERNAMGQWGLTDRTMEMSVWRLALDQEWERLSFGGDSVVWSAIPDNPEFDFRCSVAKS